MSNIWPSAESDVDTWNMAANLVVYHIDTISGNSQLRRQLEDNIQKQIQFVIADQYYRTDWYPCDTGDTVRLTSRETSQIVAEFFHGKYHATHKLHGDNGLTVNLYVVTQANCRNPALTVLSMIELIRDEIPDLHISSEPLKKLVETTLINFNEYLRLVELHYEESPTDAPKIVAIIDARQKTVSTRPGALSLENSVFTPVLVRLKAQELLKEVKLSN